MSRRARSAGYFEPWAAKKSVGWEVPFRFGPPKVDDRGTLDRYESDRLRAEANAPWNIWGTRLHEPDICTNLDGSRTVFDGRGIITVTHCGGVPKGSPTHGEIAQRIASCVSACAGIADPVATIKGMRDLLYDLCRGDADRHDDRVVAILSRMIPPEEMETFHGEE